MLGLSKQGINLLKLLVKILPDVDPDLPDTFITYSRAHDELNLKKLPYARTIGESLQHQGLNSLAEWTVSEGTPGITGLIVNGSGDDAGKPGAGFWRLYGKTGIEWDWFREEVRRCKAHDWSRYIAEADPSQSSSAPLVLSEEEGKRIDSEAQRIERKGRLRLEALSRNKKMHGGHYKCEVCSFAGNISGLFDVHHLVPLAIGVRDSTENDLVVLCPTCHRIAHRKSSHFLKPLDLAKVREWLEKPW